MTEVEDVLGSFEILGDWEQRYQYLVELGEHLAPMPDRYKVDANRVKGCMSQVWVRAYRDPEHPDLIRYLGDCDTAIIKGVVALVGELLCGRLRHRGAYEETGDGVGQPGESGSLRRPVYRPSGWRTDAPNQPPSGPPDHSRICR